MGSARDKGLRIAKEKMAPNMDAPNVQPILRPKYVLEAAALSYVSYHAIKRKARIV